MKYFTVSSDRARNHAVAARNHADVFNLGRPKEKSAHTYFIVVHTVVDYQIMYRVTVFLHKRNMTSTGG